MGYISRYEILADTDMPTLPGSDVKIWGSMGISYFNNSWVQDVSFSHSVLTIVERGPILHSAIVKVENTQGILDFLPHFRAHQVQEFLLIQGENCFTLWKACVQFDLIL